MKTSELRINNYVNYCNKIEQLDAELFLKLLKYITPFEPIQLTEEWLLKFWFDESLNDKYKYYLKPIALFRGLGENNNRFYYFMSGQSMGTEIKHVHQLQNLYFALTGEELTIN